MSMPIGKNPVAVRWGQTRPNVKAAPSSPVRTTLRASDSATFDNRSFNISSESLAGIFQSEPGTPTFQKDPTKRDATLRVARFFNLHPEYMEKEGVNIWTLTALANGTGAFSNAPDAVKKEAEAIKADAKLIIESPGLFHELDQLGSDGKLYTDNQNGWFNPLYVSTPLHTPVYM